MGDVRVWNQKNLAVLIELDALVDDPEELPVEAAPPFDGRLCSHFDLMAGESLEILELHQRSLKPGRAHLEAVTPGRQQVLVNLQGGGYVPADLRAILQRNPATDLHTRYIPVDDDPNDNPFRFAQIAHVDEFHAMSAANWVDQLFQDVDDLFSGLGQILLGVPERKTGGPWRPTQER